MYASPVRRHSVALTGTVLPFPIDGTGIQQRVLEDVAEDLHSNIDVFAKKFRVVDRLFARRVGIQVRAHVLDGDFELPLGSSLRSFEGDVLEKMRRAVVRCCFVSTSGVDPHAERDRFTFRRYSFCGYP